MSQEPGFNDTAVFYFGEDSLLARLVREGKTRVLLEGLLARIETADAAGVNLRFFLSADGKRLLARATARCGSFYNNSYDFINFMREVDLPSRVDFGMLRELFDPTDRGFIPIDTERRPADVH